MRRIILYRHAKSAWDDPDLDDFDRGLAPRGTKAAPKMGAWMRGEGYVPTLILCSDAVRTRATLTLTLDAMKPDPRPEIVFDHALYLASSARIVETIREAADTHETVMVIGHNPGLHGAALELARGGPKQDIRRLAMKFPTACAAILRADGPNWSDVHAGTCTLERFQIARALD